MPLSEPQLVGLCGFVYHFDDKFNCISFKYSNFLIYVF